MSEFSHYRCGGTLRPMTTPSWDVWDDKYARCDRCHRPGVLTAGTGNMARRFTLEEAEQVRRDYFESPLSGLQFAESLGISEQTLYAVVDRRDAYDPDK